MSTGNEPDSALSGGRRALAGLGWCVAVGAAEYLFVIRDLTGTGDGTLRGEWLVACWALISLVVGALVSRPVDWRFVGPLSVLGALLVFADLTATYLWGMIDVSAGMPEHLSDLRSVNPAGALIGTGVILGIAIGSWFFFAGTLWLGGAARRGLVRVCGPRPRRRLPG